jgi:hypothetical protein
MSFEQTLPTPDAKAMLAAGLAFAAAADAYVAADKWYLPGPVLMLLGRGLELALKAYAIHDGANADMLRYQLGSELETGLRHALDRGLAVDVRLDAQERASLRSLGEFLKSQRIGYPDVMALELPATADVRRLVERLMLACSRAIHGDGVPMGAGADSRGVRVEARAHYRSTEATERPAVRRPASEQSD